MMPNIIMYGSKLCAKCQELKAYFEKNNIKFEYRDINIGDNIFKFNIDILTLLESKRRTQELPFIIIDNQGYTVKDFEDIIEIENILNDT